MTAFLLAHQTSLVLLAAYLFSGAMSTMPELPEDAGWFVRWIHDWLQFCAANWNKFSPATRVQQPRVVAVPVAVVPQP